ncbi:hypothetical protein R2F61_07170 [Mollicutes bacterium LVI A0078]|nr:hypothetical protein R2F61_07170 [Mollicutes bacterium LVI A0078]
MTTIRNAVSDNGEDPNDLICIGSGGGSARTSSCAVSNVKVATRPTVVTKTIKDTTTNTETDSIIGKNNMEYEYIINVTNPTSTYIDDVPVRDSLLENLSGEIIWDGNLEVTYSDGSSLKPTYRGDITNGTFSIDEIDANKTVQIKYSLTFTNLQPGVSNALLNTATDTSLDPTGLCDLDTADEVDCDSAEVISEPDLSIDKTVSGLGLDGTVNVGDQLTYKISVTNNNTVDVNDVPVRDSMLENLPSYLTWDNNINITCSNIISCEKGFKGSLADGTFTLDQINAGETTKIAYNIDIVDSIPEEVDNIINIVTNTSEDPTEVCVEDGYPQENGKTCDYTESYVSAETEINKSVVDSNNNDVVEPGDILEYTLTVFNPSEIDSGKIAFGVKVKDSLVMNPLSWLTFNDDVVLTRDGEEMVKGYDYIGDLSKKTGIYIEEIAPQEKVEIKYSFTVGDSIPDDIESVINVATDNNQDPNEITECDEESTDCASVTLPVVETEEPTVPSENDSEVDSEVGGGQDIEEPSEESSGVVSEESSEVVSEEGSIMATGQQAKLLLISFNLIAIISVALLLKFRLNNN